MLNDKYKLVIKNILSKHLDFNECEVFIFGSRASGKAQKFSDIDIGIKTKRPLKYSLLSKMESDFEESDLPFKVEIVDFGKTNKRFRDVAERSLIPLN